MDVLEVRADLYESVRSVAHHFLLIPGHESPDVERVVENHGDFVVVAKHPGEPRRLAKESDPRAVGQAVSPAVAVRIAENEARFRDANEHIEEAVLRLEASAPTLPFVCECGRAECLKTLRLTIEEYEQAREDSRYFVCVPGHEIVGENVGRVVRTNGHFVLVEKQGDAGVIADRLDPRSNGESGRVEPERRHGEDVA
jgi:hypothetical protein